MTMPPGWGRGWLLVSTLFAEAFHAQLLIVVAEAAEAVAVNQQRLAANRVRAHVVVIE